MLKRVFFSIILVFGSAYALNVGEVSMVKGKANIMRDTKVFEAKILTPIKGNDSVTTQNNTKIQLMFEDETVVTLGSNTTFEVKEYLFDGKNSKLDINVKKGFFKVITGKIGKVAPRNFKLKTKTSLIGIRGTIFAGKVGAKGGKKDYIACLEGEIVVSSLDNDKSVSVGSGKAIFVNEDGSFEDIQTLDAKSFSTLSSMDESTMDSKNSISNEKANQNSTDIVNEEDSNTVSKRDNDDSDDMHSNTSDDVDNMDDNTNDDTNDDTTNDNDSSSSGNDEDDEDETNSGISTKDSIFTLIQKKETVEYEGKLQGNSIGTYTTSTSTTNLNAHIEADMMMRVDFGGNNPLEVHISNQELTLNSAEIDGNDVIGDDFDELKNSINNSNQITSSFKMQQTINPQTLKITGEYSNSANGFTKNATLNGTFSDNKANQITGTLQESTQGSANGVDIDRVINTNFDVSK